MDLDKLKLKTTTQLTPDEKLFIKENEDKLTDEDKDAYSDFLVETPAEENLDEGSEENDGSSEENTEGGENAESEQPKPLVFNTEDDAKKFVQETVNALTEKQKQDRQVEIDAAKTPEEKRYVEENWKPKDWNEGIKTTVDATIKALDEREKTQKEEHDAQAQKFASEWDGIVKANNLPKRGTKEGDEVLKKVYDIGIKYKQPTFTDAFDLYNKLPVTQGGAFGSKSRNTSQREAASKVAGQTPSDGVTKTAAPKSYQELKGKTPSQLMRDALKATS